MSVLIKGMEMPRPFDHLFVGETLRVICMVRNKTEDGDDVVWYPLIEIPPHGRLIDADAIKEKIDHQRPGRMYEDAWALTIIDDAPTVLPADKENF